MRGRCVFSSNSFFSFQCYVGVRGLHSFPTRRSSDLGRSGGAPQTTAERFSSVRHARNTSPYSGCVNATVRPAVRTVRSEEHTSELQSRVDLVCRLLLEKKKHKEHSRI